MTTIFESPELMAMRTAYTALEPLKPIERSRALRWLFDVLDVGVRVQLSVGPDGQLERRYPDADARPGAR
ncbi:hypothetical protein ACFVMC_33055 [Nocardia sp. NPDC127579]|uniref:hypothetical protein n=1 Tax=Nocardia sp. NPDC127579 TaxID=3345402 RepID=UPI00363970D5